MKIFAALVSLGITLASPAFAAPLDVAVSIVPQKYFVNRIAGDLAKVVVMVPPGGSPATYEPKPSQMVALGSSKAYFSIGVPFEKSWLPKFHSIHPSMQIVDTTIRIQRRVMGAHTHHHDADAHGEHQHALEAHSSHEHEEGHSLRDPHVWLSPQLVRLQADQIRDALIRLDPRHAAEYRRGHAAFISDIHKVDEQLLNMLQGQARPKPFMVFHPSWGYFAEAYGLKQYAIEVDGKTPSPKMLARMITEAKAHSIHTVFAQPEFSQKFAKEVAKAIHGKVVRLSPLSYDWPHMMLQAGNAFSNQKTPARHESSKLE